MKKEKLINAKEIKIFLILMAICFFIFIACNRVEGNPDNQASAEMLSYVPKNGKGTFFNNLDIGVGNIWEEDYIDNNGEPKKGITCGLWFYLRHDPSQNTDVRVYPEKKVLVANYSVEAVDIEEEGVMLKVSLLDSNK